MSDCFSNLIVLGLLAPLEIFTLLFRPYFSIKVKAEIIKGTARDFFEFMGL